MLGCTELQLMTHTRANVCTWMDTYADKDEHGVAPEVCVRVGICVEGHAELREQLLHFLVRRVLFGAQEDYVLQIVRYSTLVLFFIHTVYVCERVCV